MYNRGGQQRTTELPCGFKIKGHPREVNGKVDIHRRYCKLCIDLAAETGFCVVPEFNKTQGEVNGWNGVHKNLQKPTKIMTTAIVDGVRTDYLVDADNITDATAKVKILASLESDSDSDEDDEHTKLVNRVIRLIHIAPCSISANKYSGCALDAMSDAKLKVLIKLTEKEISDYENKKELEEVLAFVGECKSKGEQVIYAPL